MSKHNIGKKFQELFVITATADELWGTGRKEKLFLSWQYDSWDDGYFWTTEETFREHLMDCPESNVRPHLYAFETEAAARDAAFRKLKLRNDYRIESMLFRRQRVSAKT